MSHVESGPRVEVDPHDSLKERGQEGKAFLTPKNTEAGGETGETSTGKLKTGKTEQEKEERYRLFNKEDATGSKLEAGIPPVQEFNEPVDVETDPDGGLVKYWNLSGPGPLAIARSIKRIFGPAGGIIEVGACRAEFRQGSFEAETEVTVTAIIDSSKWPPNFICFTPMLDINAPGLEKPVDLHLPSWCVDDKQRNAEAQIMRKPEGSTVWKNTGKVLSVSSDPFFKFEWLHFSPIAIGMGATPFNTDPLPFRITGAIFMSEHNEMTVAHFINDDGGSVASGSMASDVVNRQMTQHNPPRLPSVIFDTINGISNHDVIETSLSFRAPPTPADFKFDPSALFQFTVDRNISRDVVRRHNAVIERDMRGDPEKVLQIGIRCKLFKSHAPAGEYPFNYIWRLGRGARAQAQQQRVSQPVIQPTSDASRTPAEETARKAEIVEEEEDDELDLC